MTQEDEVHLRRRGWTTEDLAAYAKQQGLQVDHATAIAEMILGPVKDDFAATESGNAEYFAAAFGDMFRYDHAARLWYVFGGGVRAGLGPHWVLDGDGEVDRRALRAARHRFNAAITGNRGASPGQEDPRKRMNFAIKSESAIGRRHTVELARSEEPIATDGTEWNRDPWRIGVKNGVVDLLSGEFQGELRPGKPEYMVNRWLPVEYDPKARPHRWLEFLDEVFEGRPEMPEYLQRVLGYCLTGQVTEQCFWILYGRGANGKSTLVETVSAVFGDYAWTIPFPGAGWANAMTDYQRASLAGRRLATSAEVGRRSVLDEEFIKAVTGGDQMNARHPYARPFTFSPTAKLFLRVNDKPAIRDRSHAMWRRVKLVEFNRTFPPSPGLLDELKRDSPGILAWMVEGCLKWQAEKGLHHPEDVEAATEVYREETDDLGEFISERCSAEDLSQRDLPGMEREARMRVRASAFFAALQGWYDARRTRVSDRLSQKEVGQGIRDRGFEVEEVTKPRSERGTWYLGLDLVSGTGPGGHDRTSGQESGADEPPF